MLASISDAPHWSCVEVAHVACDSSDRKAGTRKEFLAAIDALASGPTCVVLVPRHGHLDTGRMQLDEAVDSDGIAAGPIVAAALLVAQRVHLHSCWLGGALASLVDELGANASFIARLRRRGIDHFTLSGFETPIPRDPREGDRHDMFVRHGCLNAWQLRHDKCCHGRGIVRVVRVAVEGDSLVLARNQVLGGHAKTDRFEGERADARAGATLPRAGAGR